MINLRDARTPISIGFIALAVLAAGLGATVPDYVRVFGQDGVAKLFAFPVAIVLIVLLFFSRTALLMLIVLLRASTESLFESTRVSFGGGAMGIGALVNGFAILIALLLVFENPERFSRKLAFTWGWFLAIAFAGLVVSPDIPTSIRLYLQLLSTFAVFVGGWYLVENPADFRKCVKLVICSSLIPAGYGLFQLATGSGELYDDAGVRYRATLSHPNIYAFYLALVISLVFYVLKSRTFRVGTLLKFLLVLYLFGLIVMLGMTKTRSAWLAFAVIFAAYGLLMERRYLVYLFAAGVLGLFIPGIGDRAMEIIGQKPLISSATQLNSLEWRQSIWAAALSWMSPTRYATGYGLEAFPSFVTTFFSESNNINYGAHNDYVQMFFELGAIGVTAFVAMYLYALRLVIGLFRTDRLLGFVIVSVIVEYLLVAASDNMMKYLSFNWYVWFTLGAAAALANRAPDAPQMAPPR